MKARITKAFSNGIKVAIKKISITNIDKHHHKDNILCHIQTVYPPVSGPIKVPCEPRSFPSKIEVLDKEPPQHLLSKWSSNQLMLQWCIMSRVYHTSHTYVIRFSSCLLFYQLKTDKYSILMKIWQCCFSGVYPSWMPPWSPTVFVSFCSIAALDLCKGSGDLGGPSDETWPNCQQLPWQPDGNMIHRPNSNPAILHDSTRLTACAARPSFNHSLR